ncbi:MAG: type II toxin-antitoxin system death-on-curing family toxin [Lachnoclostridium sp.]|jgi:death-on-curing protein|nr:type II toxin-antitoxin system death-on-curing family toxin [Lachnoclostridium sp.]
MQRLDLETVIAIHSELIVQSGGLDGIRDNNMLDASINSPFHTFGGQYLYPTLQSMAAHLAFSLIKNHPFLDGNKRIGILSMLVFLDINGLPVDCTDAELVSLGLGLADSSISETELVEWIIAHS